MFVPSHCRRSRLARPVLALLLGFTWSVLLSVDARGQAPAPAPADAAAELRRAADELQKLFPALQEAARQVPRDAFDPQAIVEQVGRDPQKLFVWVRDNTHWAPYRGALRGSAGVLMDRSGNSLDRSLLLAELLQGIGHKARLARATLPEATAADVIAKVRALPADRFKAIGAGNPSNDALAAIAQRYGLDANAVRQAAESTVAEFAPLMDEAQRRVQEQTALLNGLSLRAAAADASAADALANLRDHWWVQAENGGAWSDFDVLLPDAASGKALVPAEKTIDLKPASVWLPLAPEDCHEVVVRVMIERWEAGKLHQQPVSQYALRPAEVLGRTVSLRHVAVNWPKELAGNPLANGPEGLKKAAGEQTEWVPLLIVGKSIVMDSSFDAAGIVHPSPNLDPTAKLAGATGGLFGGLGGGLGGADGNKPETAATVLTGEWLEFETRAPGRAPRVDRHEVYDAIGPAARAAAANSPLARPEPYDAARATRRGLALLGDVGINILGCDVHPSYVVHLAAADQLNTSAQWLELAREASVERRRERASALAARVKPHSVLYDFAIARAALNPARGDVYVDTPVIVSHRRLVTTDASGNVVTREQMDVTANPAAARPGAADPFAAVMAQGVADTVAEDLVLGGGLSGTPKEDNLESTPALFAAAQKGGLKPLLVRDAGDAAWKAIDLAPDVRTRAEQDLAGGYVLVAPAGTVDVAGDRRFGWWRVHGKTGEAVGVMDDGFHSNTTENTVVRSRSSEQMLYDRIDMLSPRTGYRGWTTKGKTPHSIANEMGIKDASQELLCKIVEMQELLIKMGL